MTIDLDRFATAGEARVARSLVHNALKIGCTVSVNDGEEWAVKRSTNRDEILAALASTGIDTVLVRLGDEKASFVLIYGNDPEGEELISDYSDVPLAVRLVRNMPR